MSRIETQNKAKRRLTRVCSHFSSVDGLNKNDLQQAVVAINKIPTTVGAGVRGAAGKLRGLLDGPGLHVMPCCFDALSAKMIENAGFSLTFLSGFSVSAAHLGLPDTQLLSYGELLRCAQTVTSTLRNIPLIVDADTGYGNAINVKRTVHGLAQLGVAGVMLEDQVAPKRCGHTKGKSVVGREEAYARIRAAADAKREGADIVILARTDARGSLGLDEALERCRKFIELGADWTFLEAPLNEEEMARYCKEVPGPKMANMLEGGATPLLPPNRLQHIGYRVAAYPLTLLSASMRAMETVLDTMHEPTFLEHGHKGGGGGEKGLGSMLLPFSRVREIVGFEDYFKEELLYKDQ